MLLLSADKTITVDGVTVFPDHADQNQFWYLPGPVSIARRTDGEACFTFIKFKPAAVEGGAKGGGFTMFTTNLKLDPATEGRIKSQLSAIAPGPGDPVLSLVQFDTGTVKCIALNLQGSGGTTATAAQPGMFNAVESILGATTPSLQGNEDASFSLTLSQEGAIILEQAYKQGTAPIGVVYDLKFTGLRPSLDVKITADFKRIYDSLSASLSGQYYFVKASLEAAFEKLVQDGAIKIEVINFTSDQDAKDKEKWALDFFTQKLLSDWFDPTLNPGQVHGDVSNSSGGNLLDAAGKALSNATSGQGGSNQGTQSGSQQGSQSGSQQGSQSGSQAGSSPARPASGSTPSGGAAAAGAGASGGSQSSPSPAPGAASSPGGSSTPASASVSGAAASSAPARAGGSGTGAAPATAPTPSPTPTPAVATHAPAALQIVSRNPDPSPAGFNIQHTPATSGLTETITITGGTTPPTVRVDGATKTLNASHQITIDVAPASSHDIVVEYPAAPRASETFDLLFQYDLPARANFSDSPPSTSFRNYLLDHPQPADAPFSGSHAPNRTSPPGGAAALHEWIGRLADPKEVELDAHASYEGRDDTTTIGYNLDLSVRRLKVAMGIIGNAARIARTQFTGDSDARTAHRVSAAGGSASNPDRVVHIKGYTDGGTSAATINARIARPADPAQPNPSPNPNPQPNPQPNPNPNPNPNQQTNPNSTPTPQQQGNNQGGGGQIAGAPAIAFKLRYVHQEEQKTMVFEYHRSDAEQRTYAPQGFFDLMLADLMDSEKHFVEVDLDDPFFREFAVTVQAPIDFQRIGLQSCHVSLDYGDPDDANNFKHDDAIFDPSRPKEHKFAVFMNANHDTGYRYATEYHFDPESGWDGRVYSYQFAPVTTEDRTLFLNPFDQIGFLEIRIFPHQVDAAVIDSIDVDLSHTDPTGDVVRRSFNVTPGAPPQFWRVRVDDPKDRSYTYQLTHHLKDGSTKQLAPVTTQATALPVNDPFDKALEIDFVPMLNPAVTRMVFIDVHYVDAKNSYERQERLTLQGNTTAVTHLRIALLDPTKTTYSYRLTFVGTNSQMKEGPFTDTTETLIAVSDS